MSLAVDTAQLAASSGDDRLVVTDNALIVLDGATAHDPSMPTAGEYVDHLAADLADSVESALPLREVLRDSIKRTTAALGISPGVAPSSTVVLVRVEPDAVDSLVLGDSSVIFGEPSGSFAIRTDDRLSRLDLEEADMYRERLRAGHGYDETHRSILRSLQIAERTQRNRPGGYWIAEADPDAASHALHIRYPRDAVCWLVAATDGVSDPLPMLGLRWSDVAKMPTHELHALLARMQTWEAEADPDGARLPRAKRHDDKTVAVLHL
ncbi:hypothetical protein AB0H20_01835 [Nocardia fluminea]|uniref:hypothetical protein n=1 Tax=Nocardia fluminea TaxID=134984 RepID=UPI0033C0848A